MNLKDHQKWLIDFYQQRHWYQYSPFIRLNFLTEETAIEIGRDHPGEKQAGTSALRANLTEELADVLDQVLIISAKFGIDPETLLAQSEHKLQARFKDELKHRS